MPPTRIIKVNTRAEASGLLERALQPDLTAEARTRAEALLRAANPHLDLHRLEPGAVIVVPDAPELRTDDTTSLDAPVLSRKDAIVEQLRALFEQRLAALDQAAAERQATTEVLKSRGLRAIEAGNTEDSANAKRLLTQVRDRLATEEKAAAQQRRLIEADLKQGLEETEELFATFA